jgi:Na+-driven multidrug efflux pump
MQPICAVAFIYDGIYKGMGKMKTLRNLLLITTFLGFIPVLLIANYFGLTLYGIWLAFVVWVFLRGLILKVDFKKSIENNTLFDD